MAHRLRTVGLEFLDSAPHRFVFEATVPVPKEIVFAAISDDPSTWTWWPGHEGGAYETPAPHGVGSRREMHMGESQYRETILAWDEPTRWAYRVDESADSLIDALVEEWVVEGDGESSTVRWTFAVEPGPDMEPAIPAAKTMINDMFEQAMANLSSRLSGVRG
ncbi:MAG: SRPBCC family protein [Acidimicrobiia bacterium]